MGYKENIIIRTFQEEDLERVIDLWNEYLPFDRIEADSILRLLDSPYYRPLGVFVAERKGKIIGFLPTMIPNESRSKGKGWILAFVLQKDLFQTDIADELLEVGERFIQSKGKKAVKFPRFKEFCFFHGIDARYSHIVEFLVSRGYRITKEIMDIKRTLMDFSVPDYRDLEKKLEKEGIRFDSCRKRYHQEFLMFLKKYFSASWYERNKKYIEENGSAKDRILALRGDDLIGFVKFDVKEENGFIGQIGVLPAIRKKKIGSLLLLKAIEEMKNRDMKTLFIFGGKIGFYNIVDGEILQRRFNLLKIF